MTPIRFLFSLILLFILNNCHSQSFTGQSWSGVKKQGRGTLDVIYYEQPGLIEKTGGGQFRGANVELINQFVSFVEKKYGTKLTPNFYNEEDGNKFYEIIASNLYTLGVGNISMTSERMLKYKFTPPVIPNIMILMSHSDSPTISKIDELRNSFKDHTSVAIAGSTSIPLLERIKGKYLPSLSITVVPSSTVLLETIQNTPKSFSIADFTELISAQRNKMKLKRHPVMLERAEDTGFMMSKKSDWDTVWNEFLTSEFKNSNAYKKIISENLGSTFLNSLQALR